MPFGRNLIPDSLAWAPRFARNTAISLPTFLLDLGLLWLLVRRWRVDYLTATIIAFLIANGLSYFLARRLVFHGTQRGMTSGLAYFLVIAALSAGAVMALMWLFVSLWRFDVILSRVAAAMITGIVGYLLNLVLNFRMHRLPPRKDE